MVCLVYIAHTEEASNVYEIFVNLTLNLMGERLILKPVGRSHCEDLDMGREK
jgi:hypothetical protein